MQNNTSNAPIPAQAQQNDGQDGDDDQIWRLRLRELLHDDPFCYHSLKRSCLLICTSQRYHSSRNERSRDRFLRTKCIALSIIIIEKCCSKNTIIDITLNRNTHWMWICIPQCRKDEQRTDHSQGALQRLSLSPSGFLIFFEANNSIVYIADKFIQPWLLENVIMNENTKEEPTEPHRDGESSNESAERYLPIYYTTGAPLAILMYEPTVILSSRFYYFSGTTPTSW